MAAFGNSSNTRAQRSPVLVPMSDVAPVNIFSGAHQGTGQASYSLYRFPLAITEQRSPPLEIAILWFLSPTFISIPKVPTG